MGNREQAKILRERRNQSTSTTDLGTLAEMKARLDRLEERVSALEALSPQGQESLQEENEPQKGKK